MLCCYLLINNKTTNAKNKTNSHQDRLEKKYSVIIVLTTDNKYQSEKSITFYVGFN